MNPWTQFWSSFRSAPPVVRRILPAEAARLVKTGAAVLIDVREPAEWTGGVAAPAHLLALSDLSGERRTWMKFLADNRGRELILYCHAGGRAGSAAKVLAGEGYQVANLGGFSDWLGARLPVRYP